MGRSGGKRNADLPRVLPPTYTTYAAATLTCHHYTTYPPQRQPPPSRLRLMDKRGRVNRRRQADNCGLLLRDISYNQPCRHTFGQNFTYAEFRSTALHGLQTTPILMPSVYFKRL